MYGLFIDAELPIYRLFRMTLTRPHFTFLTNPLSGSPSSEGTGCHEHYRSVGGTPGAVLDSFSVALLLEGLCLNLLTSISFWSIECRQSDSIVTTMRQVWRPLCGSKRLLITMALENKLYTSFCASWERVLHPVCLVSSFMTAMKKKVPQASVSLLQTDAARKFAFPRLRADFEGELYHDQLTVEGYVSHFEALLCRCIMCFSRAYGDSKV
jgi:hypothetical protein